MARFGAALKTDRVGEKEVPVLIWPDGAELHLMPHKLGPGYQDPAAALRSWLFAWMNSQLADVELDTLLDRWEQTEPPMQRQIVGRLVGIVSAIGERSAGPLTAGREPSAEALRDGMIDLVQRHRESCDDPKCDFVASLLAWFAHSVGASGQELRPFQRLLVEQELQCQRGECGAAHGRTMEGR